MKKRKGWRGESGRHSLAAKGVETTTKKKPKAPREVCPGCGRRIRGTKDRRMKHYKRCAPEEYVEKGQ